MYVGFGVFYSHKTVIQYLYNNKSKLPGTVGLLSSPYFTHDASCVVLNIDWTPL